MTPLAHGFVVDLSQVHEANGWQIACEIALCVQSWYMIGDQSWENASFVIWAGPEGGILEVRSGEINPARMWMDKVYHDGNGSENGYGQGQGLAEEWLVELITAIGDGDELLPLPVTAGRARLWINENNGRPKDWGITDVGEWTLAGLRISISSQCQAMETYQEVLEMLGFRVDGQC